MARKIGRNEASSSRSRGESVVVDHGRRRSSCGYCKSKSQTSIVHGLSASSLTVDDYQDLLDRGWRRSGSFLYKPEMEKTCCPSYTIRLKAEDFVPSKEQNRVYKRMQRYLDGTIDAKKSDTVKNESSSSSVLESLVKNNSLIAMDGNTAVKESSANKSNDRSKPEECIYYLSSKIDSTIRECIERGEFPSVQLPKATVKKVTLQAKKKLAEISGDLLYTSSISFQIAATLRRSQSEENDISQSEVSRSGLSLELTPKSIAEKLACIIDQQGELFGLSIKACNGHLNFYLPTSESVSVEATVAVNASTRSLKDSGTNAKRGGILNNHAVPPHKRRRLEIHLKRSSFDSEEYALYRKYQIEVHNDKPNEVNEGSYTRFLVDTPIIYVPPSGDSTVPPCGFGSFHQQYVIDGRLVAVGVVDILPRCLSSKYLFWDPDLAFLSLGKYSALQEIGWVKENQVHCPGLQYYYLGYYIHSCIKMRYKASYCPSELLCPLRYQWVPFDVARPLLDKKPYVVLSDSPTLENGVSTPSSISEGSIECAESSQNKQNEALGDSDEEMETDFEGSDTGFAENSSLEETSHVASLDELTVRDVGNIKIDLRETRLKFKVLGWLLPIVKNNAQKLANKLGSKTKGVSQPKGPHRFIGAEAAEICKGSGNGTC